MQVGKILVAHHEGTYVIKLVGDVRLTLCTAIDDYFTSMFASPTFTGVIVDLSQAEGVDSTTLGLLAKLAVQAKAKYQLTPLVLSPNPNITRLLESMGFNAVFDIRAQLEPSSIRGLEHLIGAHANATELPVGCTDEQCVRDKVIEAHRTLMNLTDSNRAQFSDLIKTLEASN